MGLEQVLLVVGTTVLVTVTTVAVSVVVAVRAVRRRFRRARAGLFGVTGLSLPWAGRPDLRALRGVAVGTLGSPAWWVVQRDCHRMWRAVTAADRAVGLARKSGAPVGDLPALVRQLSSAARGVDAVLRASAPDRALRRRAATERDRIEAAAAEIHHAAVDALNVMVDVDTEPMMSAVRLETAALAAGVRSAAYHRNG